MSKLVIVILGVFLAFSIAVSKLEYVDSMRLAFRYGCMYEVGRNCKNSHCTTEYDNCKVVSNTFKNEISEFLEPFSDGNNEDRD